MITIEKLLATGYREYPATIIDSWAICLLQKKVMYEGYESKVKYFINIYPSKVTGEISYTTKIRYYRGDDAMAFTLFTESIHTIKHIEQLAEEIWLKMGMDFDHHNN
ncbi:MAG: hypothetical protein ABH952_08530 [Candidatus Omnitrophota bacterium]